MLDKIHKEFYKVKDGLLEVLRGKNVQFSSHLKI